VAIFVLVLWVVTAAVGASLLWASGRARQAAAGSAFVEPVLAEPVLAEAVLAEAVLAEPLAVGSAVRTGAVPMTPEGRPPRGPHVRVTTPAGEHPLLEFSHPALAVAGIACWMMFTYVHYRPLAWIAVAILGTTILLGLAWLVRSRQAARQHPRAARSFPPQLILLHGLVAGLSIVLSVLAALTASRA
jgi:Flp pilus assembly protein TadB